MHFKRRRRQYNTATLINRLEFQQQLNIQTCLSSYEIIFDLMRDIKRYLEESNGLNSNDTVKRLKYCQDLFNFKQLLLSQIEEISASMISPTASEKHIYKLAELRERMKAFFLSINAIELLNQTNPQE